MLHTGRRLIEDLLPTREISAEAAREKSLRHGNISTLHSWWARRPIVAARAAVYGALVSTPASDEERQVYEDRMKKLCRWNFHHGTLELARQDILAANKGRPPRVLAKSTLFPLFQEETCDTFRARDTTPGIHLTSLT